MPRANRYILPGHCYHLTHRCHNRAFLLKFARDRDRYRERLRNALEEINVRILQYTITSNHVHLLARAVDDEISEISRLMQCVQGQHAQEYNRRRRRHGAFWEDRYHATSVEGGVHLWRCLTYIDLNMARAGVVPHPMEWEWTGWHELTGARERYRLIDIEALLESVGVNSMSEFRANYQQAIAERLARKQIERESEWTESVAVGSRQFVEQIGSLLQYRQTLEYAALDDTNSSWTLRDTAAAYGQYLIPENSF